MDHMLGIMKVECDWYVFQEEVGDEEETPHLQGVLKTKTRKRLSGMKSMLGPKLHWEPMRSMKASIAYCSAVQKRMVGGHLWVHGIEIEDPVEVDEPYGWQLQVMEIIKEKPDRRSIYWFWEPDGNKGKSTFSKYLVVRHNALMVGGASKDMFHALAKEPGKRKLIVVDIPKEKNDFINYGAIEAIKNGLVFSGKYEGAQLVFNCPHVFVFANKPPDAGKWSEDRPKVFRI